MIFKTSKPVAKKNKNDKNSCVYVIKRCVRVM